MDKSPKPDNDPDSCQCRQGSGYSAHSPVATLGSAPHLAGLGLDRLGRSEDRETGEYMGWKNKTSSAVAWCPTHGKLSYTDRKRARQVARQHPEHKNAYRCSDNPDLWHIGGLPDEVKHGHMTKDEFYGRYSSGH